MSSKCPSCQADLGPDILPRHRFDEEATARKLAVARVTELEASLQEAAAKASAHDALAQQLAQIKAEHEAERNGWGTERALLSHGISDAEGLEYVRMAYDRVKPGEGGAKPDLATWLSDRTKLPKAVLAYLPEPAPEAPPVPSPTPTRVGQIPQPPANAGVRPSSGVAPGWSPDALAKMSVEELRQALPEVERAWGLRR